MKNALFFLHLFFNGGFVLAQNAEKNKADIQRFYEAFNQKDTNTIYSFYAPSVKFQMSGGRVFNLSIEMLKKTIEDNYKAFSDGKNEIINIVADGDWVSVCDRRTGTNSGSWMGVSAPGKMTDFLVMEMYRLQNGKIVEIILLQDNFTAFKQLGIIPAKITGVLQNVEEK